MIYGRKEDPDLNVVHGPSPTDTLVGGFFGTLDSGMT